MSDIPSESGSSLVDFSRHSSIFHFRNPESRCLQEMPTRVAYKASSATPDALLIR